MSSRKSTAQQGYRFSQDGADDICVIIRRIPGSPAYMAQEVYACEDAPGGWYATGDNIFIDSARDSAEAANMMANLIIGRRSLDRIQAEARIRELGVRS